MTASYYDTAQVQDNYHCCWGKDNMHIGLFPQVEELRQEQLGMEAAAGRLTTQMVNLMKLSPDSVVLDLGCGFGQALEQIVNDKGCTGTGLDLTPSLIKQAQDRTKDNPRVKFVEGSYVDLPEELRKQRYTHVMSIQALVYGHEDMDRILAQVKAALVPGGCLCISEFVGTDDEITDVTHCNFYKRVKLNPLLSWTTFRAALVRAGFGIKMEQNCSSHAQEGYRLLAESAKLEARTSPDGSPLGDAYEKTSSCIASNQLGLMLVVAELQDGAASL